MLLPTDFSYPVFGAILLLIGAAMGLFASPNRAAVMNSLPEGRPRRRRGDEPDLPELRPGPVDRDLLHADDHRAGRDAARDDERRACRRTASTPPPRTTWRRCRRCRSCSPPSWATTRSSTCSARTCSRGSRRTTRRRSPAARSSPTSSPGPFQDGLHAAFVFAIVACLIAAGGLAAARRAHGPRRAARARRRTRSPAVCARPNSRSNMQVEWYGQSAFRLTDGATTVFIDPFDDLTALAERGMRWEYPAIEGVEADLLLVTHEHLDHNGVGADRRRAGRHCARPPGAWSRRSARSSPSPPSTTTPPAPSAAPTRSSPSPSAAGASPTSATSASATLREEQAQALGSVDLLFVPVGGGPTIGAEQADRDRRAARRPGRRADALPHRAHRLPRARRRLRRSARSASSAWSRARSTSRRSPAATAARRRARRAVSRLAQRRCSVTPSTTAAEDPIENRPSRGPAAAIRGRADSGARARPSGVT